MAQVLHLTPRQQDDLTVDEFDSACDWLDSLGG
jgi:hypothetical protein